MHDLALRGGNIIDVRSLRIEKGDVLIKDGIIAEIGGSSAARAGEVIDISGKYVSPGLVDSHLHIESSMLSPLEFSREAVRHGTTALFADPHEIANVLGRKGIELFLRQSDLAPLDMFVGIPSCVPATPLEDSGASITVEDIRTLLPDRRIFGLAEMMNFPGIIHGLGDARKKVEMVFRAGKIVDGHCPGVTGKDLRLYVTNGKDDAAVRIMSDHESTRLEEAMEKAGLGMQVALRYGSASRDMERILPGLLKSGIDLKKFMLCSDDLDPVELFEKGHVDRIVRKAREIIQKTTGSSLELATASALALATLHPSLYFSRFFRFHGYPASGEIASGKKANLVVFESLEDLAVDKVIHNGALVVNEGEYAGKESAFDYSDYMGTVNPGRTFAAEDFRIKVSGQQTALKVRVIGAIPGSLLTEERILKLPVSGGELEPDPARDIARIAVIERHRGTGSYASAFVQGLGIQKGAVASTVAHDSHNLIVAGADEESMARAVNFLIETGGGMVVVTDNADSFPLPIAGLMSSEAVGRVVEGYRHIQDAARRTGSRLKNTFMVMSFLALPVIPRLKITNRGLVDVGRFELVSLYE